MYERRRTRQIHVGKVAVGGDAPISVQSMTTTKTADVEGTLQQIYALAAAGCDIVRCTCNEEAAAEGRDQVRIVYGKGRRGPGGVGALRVAIPDFVAARTGGLVLRFERQVESDGHDG